jgi:hypothetical protein
MTSFQGDKLLTHAVGSSGARQPCLKFLLRRAFPPVPGTPTFDNLLEGLGRQSNMKPVD